MAKQPKKREPKYDPKLALKEGVEWNDLIGLSLQSQGTKPTAKKKPAKKKK